MQSFQVTHEGGVAWRNKPMYTDRDHTTRGPDQGAIVHGLLVQVLPAAAKACVSLSEARS